MAIFLPQCRFRDVRSPSRVENPLGGVARLTQVEGHGQHQDDPTSDEGNSLS